MAKESVGAHNIGFDNIRDARIEKIAKQKELAQDYKDRVSSFKEGYKIETSDEEMKRIKEKVDREDLQSLIEDMVRTEPDNRKIEEQISQMERFERFRPFLKSFIENKRSKVGQQVINKEEMDK